MKCLFRNLHNMATVSIFEYQNPKCKISGITSPSDISPSKFYSFLMTLPHTYLSVMKMSVTFEGKFISIPILSLCDLIKSVSPVRRWSPMHELLESVKPWLSSTTLTNTEIPCNYWNSISICRFSFATGVFAKYETRYDAWWGISCLSCYRAW